MIKMEIIKVGNVKDTTIPIQKTCYDCKTIFKCIQSDIKNHPYKDGIYVVCPVCGKFIGVNGEYDG